METNMLPTTSSSSSTSTPTSTFAVAVTHPNFDQCKANSTRNMPAPAGASFTQLPAELKLEVLSHIPNFDTLCATIAASHSYLLVFTRYAEPIMRGIAAAADMENGHPTELADALELLVLRRMKSYKGIKPFIARYKSVGPLSAATRTATWLPQLMSPGGDLSLDVARQLLHHQTIVRSLTARFCLDRLPKFKSDIEQEREDKADDAEENEKEPPATTTETARVATGFYRLWVFIYLYGDFGGPRDGKYTKDDCPKWSDPMPNDPESEDRDALFASSPTLYELETLVAIKQWTEQALEPTCASLIARHPTGEAIQEPEILQEVFADSLLSRGFEVIHDYLVCDPPPSVSSLGYVSDESGCGIWIHMTEVRYQTFEWHPEINDLDHKYRGHLYPLRAVIPPGQSTEEANKAGIQEYTVYEYPWWDSRVTVWYHSDRSNVPMCNVHMWVCMWDEERLRRWGYGLPGDPVDMPGRTGRTKTFLGPRSAPPIIRVQR
ncbi:hypothetical protein EDC01DRAFT_680786 [Geopyxis carbonaria]|nr:hypothetical protein EDC01DRAFT_680786 [Geopyxis carbonaria]